MSYFPLINKVIIEVTSDNMSKRTWGCTESALPRPFDGNEIHRGPVATPPPTNKQIKLISSFPERTILTRVDLGESGLSSSLEDLGWDGFSWSLALSKASFWLKKKIKSNLKLCPQKLASITSSGKLSNSNKIGWNTRIFYVQNTEHREWPGWHVKEST